MKNIFFLFLCLSFHSYAQKAPIKWGKVSPEELAMTSYEHDQDAEAVILCDYGKITLVELENDFEYQFHRIRRVKILKESGLSQGDIFIPYRHFEGYQKIKNIGAQVYLPDGSKQKISKKDIFTEVKSKYSSSKNFSIPNLKEGSVFEYHYEISSKDITHLKEWYFQEDLPIMHSELQINIPNYFEYIFMLNGYELTSAPKNLNASDYGSSLKVVSATNPFILKDIPAIEEERFITCLDDYRLGIRFQLNKIHYPSGHKEPFLTTWPLAAKEIEEHRYIGQQYLHKKNNKKLLAQTQALFAEATTDQQKVDIATIFLQNNLTFSGYTSYSAREALDRLFERKEVHTGEMNLFLMALLHGNGVAVYPLMVSTRDNGRMIPSYPIIDQFNHLMVYAVIDGKEQILDLGSRLRPTHMPRTRALNNTGWLVNGENSKWIDVKAPRSRQVIMANMTINEEGNMQGQLKGKYSGYDALKERFKYDEDETGKYWQKRLAAHFSEAEVNNFEVKNPRAPALDFMDEFDCVIPEAIQESGDLIYLQPVLYADFFENPFKQDNRFYPIDIPYPSQEQYIFNCSIPEGYTVESLPEALNIRLFEKSASFNYRAKEMFDQVKGNQLVVTCKLQLNRLRYSPLEYGNMKAFFDQMIEKLQEPIVLKK